MCAGALAECKRPTADLELRLAPVPQAPAEARAFVRERLPVLGLPHLVENATLVADELVTNSYEHAPAGPLDDLIRDVHYITPLYRKAEAARLIDVHPSTFRNWAVGYAYKRVDRSEVVSQPIVTTVQPATLQGPSVPFVGLAEAYIVAAFTNAGLPMRRIRPAVLWVA